MPTYNINHTDINKDPKVVEEGSVNEHELDIALIGRIRLEYGERVNQNLLNLLENFSSDADPSLVPATPTPMPTTSVTPSGVSLSQTPTPTVTRTPTRTVSVTASITASISVTPTPTRTPTPTPAAPSVTPTHTVSPTVGASPTPTVTPTHTVTPAATLTPTPSAVYSIDLSDIPTDITGIRASTPANASLTFNSDGTFTVLEHDGADDGLSGDWTSGTGSDYELFYTYVESSVGGDLGDPGAGAGGWLSMPTGFYASDSSPSTENIYTITITIRKIADHTDTKTIVITLDADGS